jgi:aspartokinase
MSQPAGNKHVEGRGWVVLKFGGTSVENAAALRRVASLVAQQEGAVVVVRCGAGAADGSPAEPAGHL